MEITIVIDKSTFQSLSFSELYRLSCYYKHVVTPVLTMEILGDLKKEFQEGKSPSQDRVKDFANKLFPIETVVNLHYKVLVKGDLLGNGPSMDGRPNVGIQKAVESRGQKGFLVEETQEERSIYKWKDGKFSEADHELSTLWRMTTTQEDILKRLKDSIKSEDGVKIKDFQSLNGYVTAMLDKQEMQFQLLTTLMQNYDVDPGTGLQIFARWKQKNFPLVKTFAPYAYHCLRVDTLFSIALAQGLISTRPTNRVDLEYIYYLPFCNIFTSNDKVHRNLVPLLLLPYQRFIIGTELKQDLKAIVSHLDSLAVDEKRKFKNQPPILDDSMTFKLWKEFFNYPVKSNWNRDLSETEIAMMKKRMNEFVQDIEGDAIEFQGGNDTDFVIKKSYLTKDDVCFCGSGKRVIDCCIPEEEFNKLAHQEWLKRQKKKK